MANAFLKKLFGDSSTRELKKIQPKVQAVEALEQEYAALSDQELKSKTQQFKDRYQKGESLDDLLPEAFAACREAAWRVLEMKLPRAAHRRHRAPSGAHRRNENR